jgi:catechol 2,3-dioxygenase-like lactoylglutathione lyase family enzyme
MKLGYTLLYVEDVEKTVSFYEAAFGLKRRFVHESGYGELETGATALGFVSLALVASHGVPVAPARLDGPAPPAEIAFVTDDVAAYYATATKAGAVALAPPKQKPWGQTVAYVRDLNGFLVELCSPV